MIPADRKRWRRSRNSFGKPTIVGYDRRKPYTVAAFDREEDRERAMRAVDWMDGVGRAWVGGYRAAREALAECRGTLRFIDEDGDADALIAKIDAALSLLPDIPESQPETTA